MIRLSLTCFVLAGASIAVAEEYPLRKEYPAVVPITTADLAAAPAVIVDSRNTAEFEVIHIVGAKLLLLGKMTSADLEKLRPKTGDRRLLVFYCNGTTCAKSYKAAAEAMEWGFENVRCYDAGVFAWAAAYPKQTEFFGEKLTAEKLKTSLISDAEFKALTLKPTDLLTKSRSGYTVVDLRDSSERAEHKFNLAGVKVMNQDTYVSLLKRGDTSLPKTKVIFVDNVGKQVVWLHYHLRRHGASDYLFLEGGVRTWLEKARDK
jgi:rhodanese-related sulfurtransferase